MPLTDEFFASNNINVTEHEGEGVSPHVELTFYGGFSGVQTPNGPDPLYAKRTKLDPNAAVKIGEALAESGRKLGGTSLDLSNAADMAAAEAEAQAQAALRNGSLN